MTDLPAERKRALRAEMLAARKRLPPLEREVASLAIAARVASLPAFAAARTVALYPAMGAEVDTAEIARRGEAAGKRLAWPRLEPGLVLSFATCRSGELVAGPAGTRQPPPEAPVVPLAEIEVALVPGVAFDAQGQRLGRGRGHYDATLAALPRRAVRVGLAFEAQLVPEVPREPHDVPLDAVVTERRTILASPAGAGGTPSGG